MERCITPMMPASGKVSSSHSSGSLSEFTWTTLEQRTEPGSTDLRVADPCEVKARGNVVGEGARWTSRFTYLRPEALVRRIERAGGREGWRGEGANGLEE